MAASAKPEGQPGMARGGKRVVWWALLGATALVATFAQFDQQSRSNPGLALFVPEAFRNQAAGQRTMLALGMGNGQALTEAQTLLRHNPVPAESLTLYAIAADAEGKADLAGKAIVAAAARGWREPIAQGTMAQGALEAGKYQIALDRLVALWRVGMRDERIVGLFQTLAEKEKGRKALVERLRRDEAWRRGFISWGRYNLKPKSFSEILATGMASGLAFECDELSDAATGLLRAGDLGSVGKVWAGACARGTLSGSVAGFAFQPEDAKRGPYNWAYPNTFGLTRTIRSANGQVTMTASNSEPLTALIAERYAALKSGSYSLAVQSPEADSSKRDLVRTEVSCIRPGGEVSRAIQTSTSDGASTFFVPAQECAVQRFRINLRRGSLDDFSLQLRAR